VFSALLVLSDTKQYQAAGKIPSITPGMSRLTATAAYIPLWQLLTCLNYSCCQSNSA
jgi:hypothetical protein